MRIRVQRTHDTALIKAIVTEPGSFEARAEDGLTTDDVVVVDDPRIYWLALMGDDAVRGIAIASPLSHSVLDFHIVIRPQYWRDPVNVRLARLALRYLEETAPQIKIVGTVPVTAQPVIRFLQRAGFKREGLNKASFRHKGVLVDQCYLGYTGE
jgi:RimJ/RimL family protein N-acetyltransferase